MRDSAIRISVLNQIFSSFRHWKLKAKITFLEVLYLRACAFILKICLCFMLSNLKAIFLSTLEENL